MIRRIMADDVNHLIHNMFALVVAVGVCFLAALYAWANIYSNWDPYGLTGNLKMAVVSLDEGYTDEDGVYHNAGDDLVDQLHDNDKMDWQFSKTKKEAVEAVEKGKFYGAIVIPKDFSYNMYNVFVNTNNRPKLEFYQNQKKNPVANKITDTVVETIESNVDEEFVKVMVETVFENANDLYLDVEDEGGLDGLIDKMTRVRGDVRSYKTTINTAKKGSLILKRALNRSSEASDEISRKTKKASDNMKKAQADTDRASNTVEDYSKDINATLDDVTSSLEDCKKILQDAKLAEDSQAFVDQMNKCIVDCNRIIADLVALREAITGEGDSLTPTQAAAAAIIDSMIEQMQSNVDELIEAKVEAMNSEAASFDASTRETLIKQIDGILDTIDKNQDIVEKELKPAIKASLDNLRQVLDDSSYMINKVSDSMLNMGGVFSALQLTINSSDRAFDNTYEALNLLDKKLTKLIDTAKDAKEDELYQDLVTVMQGDPETYGEFFSEPVEMVENDVYSMENYGSSVSPFYTVLALWVGALLLTAIIKVKPTASKYPDAKPYELFFGRYLIFYFLGQLQAIIIVLGNILVLGIQCRHPMLYWFASSMTSLVFTLLIYSLVVAAGDVGKAAAVVIVVLQIAGSSGTYPIELLPDFFQNVYIFFPFPYAINAVRESVGGLYGANYVLYLLRLCIFIVVSLVIGLWIQKPLERINEYMEERMEDTEIL